MQRVERLGQGWRGDELPVGSLIEPDLLVHRLVVDAAGLGPEGHVSRRSTAGDFSHSGQRILALADEFVQGYAFDFEEAQLFRQLVLLRVCNIARHRVFEYQLRPANTFRLRLGDSTIHASQLIAMRLGELLEVLSHVLLYGGQLRC